MVRKVRSEIRKLGESGFKGWNDSWKPQAYEDSKTDCVHTASGRVQTGLPTKFNPPDLLYMHNLFAQVHQEPL